MNSPLKWHGGKHYLADRINETIARSGCTHYVEPYAGGLSVLLSWEGGERSELVNDLDLGLTNFWRCLQGEYTFDLMKRTLDATPLSHVEWNKAEAWPDPQQPLDVGAALAFFVACRQSLAGRRKNFTALTRSRLRRGINGNASEWLGAIEGLPDVHERLRPVVIECMDAAKLVRREDHPNTVFYLDPPYVHDTRVATDAYAHEMTLEQHRSLLDALAETHSCFVLSGYDHPLYKEYEQQCGWRREEVSIANHSAGGESKRRMTEVLWRNFV